MQRTGTGCGVKTSFTAWKRRLFGLPVTKPSIGFGISARFRAATTRHKPTAPRLPGSTNGAYRRRLKKGGPDEAIQPERVQARKSARVSPPGGHAALRHAGQGRRLLELGDQVVATIQSRMRMFLRPPA